MQKAVADRSKINLEEAKVFHRPIVTEILPFTAFYSAGEDQQQFCQRNPVRYYSYTMHLEGTNIRKEYGEI